MTPPIQSNVDRSDALYRMLRNSARDRLVAPPAQPFAFCSNRGQKRSENQDNALVLTGRRLGGTRPFLAAIVCDGMGGLEAGDDAADLALATAGAVLCSDASLPPDIRIQQAISVANRRVFEKYRGRAGAVLVTALVDLETADQPPVIGWVGDARAYGLTANNGLVQLTRDDTVAAQIEALEGPAPEAMNQPLQAIGVKSDVRPNIAFVPPEVLRLLLVSDGVHRIDPAVLSWIRRYARNTEELVERLVQAAYWQEGLDNATSLAIDLQKEALIHEDGPVVLAWVHDEPRIWQMIPSPRARGRMPRETLPGADFKVQRTATVSKASKKRGQSSGNKDSARPQKSPAEQPQLIVDFDEETRKP